VDEAQLVEGLRARRDDAVREYLSRYRPLFHHCIAHFENDASRREDLQSELAWHALERLDRDSFDAERGSFGTWLYRVAWCRAVDLKRQQNARRRVQLTSGLDELPERADPAPEPAEDVGQSEIGELVRAALEELEPQSRRLLELRHGDGMEMQAVADALSISLEQAKYRLKRATSAMRHALLARLPREEVLE
jgi:RNA polymerase sigma-70 factor (ECF subfamily)